VNIASRKEIKVPESYEEAMRSEEKQEWERAMDQEIMNHEQNGTWEVLKRSEVPNGKQVLKGRWVYALKKNEKGEVTLFKARWVGKGFQQKPGRDFFDVSSPVMSVVTLRIIAALVACKGWKTKQGDFVAAYLNGKMDVVLFMELPTGYGAREDVCRVVSGIYGFRQSGLMWNRALDVALGRLGFKRSWFDPCLYVLKEAGHITLFAVWVDDFILTGSNEAMLDRVFEELSKEFKAKDLGELTYMLGVAFEIDSERGLVRVRFEPNSVC
jgi:hypothetical protein